MRRIGILLLAVGCLFGRVAFGATDLIADGGFELSSTGPWQLSGNFAGISFVSDPSRAHGGTNFLSMGNENGPVFQRIFQSVTVPADTLLATFGYFWSGSTTDAPVTAQLSSIIIYTNAGVAHLTSLQSDVNANVGYQQRLSNVTNFVNLANFAGQTVLVGFQIDFANSTAGAGSTFRVDDVSLLAFTTADIPPNDFFADATLLTTTTNVSLTATNVLATSELNEPKHAGKTGGHSLWWKWTAPANGELVINTVNSTFDTLLAVYTGTSVSSLTPVAANDDANPDQNIFTSKVKLLVNAGTEYLIAVDGKNGATGVVQLSLAFSADSTDPKVVISSPKSGAKLTTPSVLVQGTASDNLAVATVQFRLENAAGTNDYQNADGTNTWTATVDGLIPGPNTIRVRAFDTSGNESASVANTVTFVVVSPLTVNISGTGTVTPNLNGTSQNVGATLTMTAKPGAGQAFANWTGDVTATTAALTFVMQSNMVLQANFVPNPFTSVAGTYQGLFYDTTGPAHKSSGFLSATLSSAGAFSAKIVLAGQKLSLSGQFSAGGSFSNNIVRKGLTPVSAQLNLDLANGGITGQLSDGTWIAQLIASKTLTSPGATAGKYTLVIPGGTDGVAEPGGEGYGTIVVSSTGGIALKGALADGSKIAQKANLLVTGQWPFYVPLYSGGGSIFGWLTVTNGVIDGTLDWFKPAQPGGKLYPAGFAHGAQAVGSVYRFTNGVPVLDFSTGQLWLANGNLAGSFTNEITLDSASKITSTNATLKVTVSTSTGSIKGSVANPAGGKPISFTGVVLQQQGFGSGFFVGTNQTGRVFLRQ
jgi:hypothetical protein